MCYKKAFKSNSFEVIAEYLYESMNLKGKGGDKIAWIWLITALFFVINACKEDDAPIKQFDLEGHVQKGPYIVGASVTISELSTSFEQTGKTFTSQTSDNSGAFEISDIGLVSSYVQVSASGYYFDEVNGSISSAPLVLNGISDITNSSTVNINILTHLEKLRVEYLIEQGHPFLEAKETAQAEVLAAFGIADTQLINSEFLDIAFDNNGGAILLAVSIILQGDRSVGDLSELLATITNDMREDGTLDNAGVLSNLRTSTKKLSLTSIRTNLTNRYTELNSNFSIPAFEEYVQAFLAFTGEPPVSATLPATNIGAFSAQLNGTVRANSLPTTVTFEYGTSTSYGLSAIAMPTSVNGHIDVNVSAQLTELIAARTYHFRIKSENSKGVVYGDDLTFITLGGAPVVSTLEATNVQPTECTINGIVNPNNLSTTITFEYGLTTSYGNTVTVALNPLLGNSDMDVSTAITGLTSGKTYHFRIKAENQLGTSVGEDRIFIPFAALGSVYGGGKLGYVLQPGDPGYDPDVAHGLIYSDFIVFEDQYPHMNDAMTSWSFGTASLIGASGEAIGAGMQNTNHIVASLGDSYGGFPSRTYAAKACYILSKNGFDDWFLPSIGELDAVFKNYPALGFGVNPEMYLSSSTEYSDTECWLYNFQPKIASGDLFGTRIHYSKTSDGRVIPMRYF